MAEPSLISKTYPTREIAPRRGVGILMFGGLVLFIASLLIAGGLFLYKNLLLGQIRDLTASLKKLEADFEPSLIEELSRTSQAIAAAGRLLAGHSFSSRIFKFLEDNTLETIRFSDFRFDRRGGKAVMVGEAKSYTALAEQAAIFEKSPLVKNLTLANLSLKENGNVNFSLEIIFDPVLWSAS